MKTFRNGLSSRFAIGADAKKKGRILHALTLKHSRGRACGLAQTILIKLLRLADADQNQSVRLQPGSVMNIGQLVRYAAKFTPFKERSDQAIGLLVQLRRQAVAQRFILKDRNYKRVGAHLMKSARRYLYFHFLSSNLQVYSQLF